MRALVIAALLGLAMTGSAAAQPKDDGEGVLDEENNTWKEIAVKIPAYPETADMRQIDGGDRRGYRYYLDTKSVAVGEDGVVRFALAIVTPGGGSNVTFEGIRCEQRDYRVYAIGRSDRTWSNARNSQWRHVQAADVDNHRGILAEEYFCDRKVPKPHAEIQRLVNRAAARLSDRRPYPGP